MITEDVEVVTKNGRFITLPRRKVMTNAKMKYGYSAKKNPKKFIVMGGRGIFREFLFTVKETPGCHECGAISAK